MSGTARVSVTVAVTPAAAFEIFTRDIDRWWRRGIRFRNSGTRSGIIALEPRVGGRLFESFDGADGSHVIPMGVVQVWDPPQRLMFSWRNANYAPGEHTQVDILFAPARGGTLVTVTHHGLTGLMPEHPARHGLADAAFLRMIGIWWGDQMTSLRELVAAPPA